MPSWRGRGLAVVAALMGVATACARTTGDPSGALDRDDASAAPLDACGTCLAASCAFATSRCNAEPTCAAWDRCASRSCEDGGACADTCPQPKGSAAESAAADLSRCRASARSSCNGCPSGKSAHPLLDDACSGVDDFYRVDRASCTAPPTETPGRVRCRACMVSRCCESRRACENDVACKSMLGCTYCDENTFTSCFDRIPAGIPRYGEYLACVNVSCARDCLDDPSRLDPCVACWFDRCGDEFATWHALPEVARADACSLDCKGNESCSEKCNEASTRLPEYGVFSLCQQARCRDACGF
ncbi:MAG: hypothetical protein IPG50_22020 [Myxococcales bacterium]|nr:hypothetical protein [Myxococcales bacterium]